jgi:hypothetical protein
MPARRTLALALLAVLGVAAAGALLIPLGCDDGCPPDCGDCLACGLLADAVVAAPACRGLARAGVVPSLGRSLRTASPRPLDHVPLSAAA